MKKKALSDTLIKRIAGTLPSGRVLLKGKKKSVGMAGKHKGNDEGLQGDRGGENLQAKQDIRNRLVSHAQVIPAFDF